MAHSIVTAGELALLTPAAIRIGRIERILRRGPADFRRLADFTGASAATLKRDLCLLRDLGALVRHDDLLGGYVLQNRQELPPLISLIEKEVNKWL